MDHPEIVLGEELNRNLYNIYISFFYFITSTVTTVGYGDYYAITNTERNMIMVFQAIGLLVFTTSQQHILRISLPTQVNQIISIKRKNVSEFIGKIDRVIPSTRIP